MSNYLHTPVLLVTFVIEQLQPEGQLMYPVGLYPQKVKHLGNVVSAASPPMTFFNCSLVRISAFTKFERFSFNFFIV